MMLAEHDLFMGFLHTGSRVYFNAGQCRLDSMGNRDTRNIFASDGPVTGMRVELLHQRVQQ